jgi:hypothetical protein
MAPKAILQNKRDGVTLKIGIEQLGEKKTEPKYG